MTPRTLRLPAIMLLAAACACLAYWPMTHAGFRHDDFQWQQVAREWERGERPLTQGHGGVTPVFNLLYFALHRQFGLDTRPYFVTMIALHALVTALVTLLVWWVLEGEDVRKGAGAVTRPLQTADGRAANAATLAVRDPTVAALAAGLLFAWLFPHQEAVAWPAAGLHVLAGLNVLLAALCWLAYRSGRPSALLLSVCFATLAVFSKDSAVSLLPLLLAVDYTLFRTHRHRPLLWHLIPYALFVAWRVLLPPSHEVIAAGTPSFALGWHMLSNLLLVPPQMVVPDLRFANYAALLGRVLPAHLLPLVFGVGWVLIGLLTALALLAAVCGNRVVRLGVLWCTLGFLPFLPFAYDYARTPRYGYIPSIGLALLTGALVQWAWQRRGWRRWLPLTLLGLYLLGSLGLLQMAARNRLRDSAVRRLVLATVQERVPSPVPGTRIELQGLPQPFMDLVDAVPLLYHVPVTVAVNRALPQAIRFVFDPRQPGRLLAVHPPP